MKAAWKGTIAVLSTAPDMCAAEKLADALVAEKLVACVNLIPQIRSIYRWKDRVQREQEVLLIMKTVRRRLKDVRKRIRELHPYEVPEILVLNVYRGSEEYLKWISRSVRP